MSLFGDEAIQKWMRQMPPAFQEWLEGEQVDSVNKLMGASDLLTVGRFQGVLQILGVLRELRKEA